MHESFWHISLNLPMRLRSSLHPPRRWWNSMLTALKSNRSKVGRGSKIHSVQGILCLASTLVDQWAQQCSILICKQMDHIPNISPVSIRSVFHSSPLHPVTTWDDPPMRKRGSAKLCRSDAPEVEQTLLCCITHERLQVGAAVFFLVGLSSGSALECPMEITGSSSTNRPFSFSGSALECPMEITGSSSTNRSTEEYFPWSKDNCLKLDVKRYRWSLSRSYII